MTTPEEEVLTCQHCRRPIPPYQPSNDYCSSRCRKRAKTARYRRNKARQAVIKPPTFTCPACQQEGIPVPTPVGAVCGDCAPFRSCGKLAYRSLKAAEWAITGFRVRSIQDSRFQTYQRSYQCPLTDDGHWHLTTQRIR